MHENSIHHCEDGWVPEDTLTAKRADGERIEYPTVAPCGVCRPGRRAVFDQGMDHIIIDGVRQTLRWDTNPAAVAAFVRAEEAAGHAVLFDKTFPAFKGKRSQVMQGAQRIIHEDEQGEDGDYE